MPWWTVPAIVEAVTSAGAPAAVAAGGFGLGKIGGAFMDSFAKNAGGTIAGDIFAKKDQPAIDESGMPTPPKYQVVPMPEWKPVSAPSILDDPIMQAFLSIQRSNRGAVV